MRSIKKYILFFLTVGMFMSLFTGCSASMEKHRVAVITKSTTSTFWKTVYAGVNAAAVEYNVDITFEGPDNEEDYQTQNQLIRKAVDQKVQAIVFSAIDYNKSVEDIEYAIDRGIPVIIIDSDVNSQKVSVRISTDNYKAGGMAGQAVLDLPLSEIHLGIVNFDKNSANGQQREQGFRDRVMQDDRVKVLEGVNVQSNIDSAVAGTKEMIAAHPDINVIATFNEWTSLGVGYAIQELGLQEQVSVIAFDNNIVSVGMLETGEVDALVVQDPFAMGYLGVECAYQILSGKTDVNQKVDTETTVITKENMFNENSQKVLFPFEQ